MKKKLLPSFFGTQKKEKFSFFQKHRSFDFIFTLFYKHTYVNVMMPEGISKCQCAAAVGDVDV